MAPTRVKICGITSPEDARGAADAGADAIGLVFYAGSPRAVNLDQAAEIVEAVPPFVTVVGLFVDEPAGEIERILSGVNLDMLQFHGDEDAAFCAGFQRPWLKAVRVQPGADVAGACSAYPGARGMLLDSWQEGVPGGTGQTFDWRLAPRAASLPIILAGGLNAANVAEAISQVNPVAVDVSGGVETAPGVKDVDMISEFVTAVRAADRAMEEMKDDK